MAAVAVAARPAAGVGAPTGELVVPLALVAVVVIGLFIRKRRRLAVYLLVTGVEPASEFLVDLC